MAAVPMPVVEKRLVTWLRLMLARLSATQDLGIASQMPWIELPCHSYPVGGAAVGCWPDAACGDGEELAVEAAGEEGVLFGLVPAQAAAVTTTPVMTAAVSRRVGVARMWSPICPADRYPNELRFFYTG